MIRAIIIKAAGFITFCMMTVAQSAAAQDGAAQDNALVYVQPITVAGSLIPGVFEEAEPGPYNEIYDTVTAEFPGEIRFNMMPIRRAQRSFYSMQSMCTFVGTNDVRFLSTRGIDIQKLIFSTPVKRNNVRVYTMPDMPIVHNAEQLADSVIALDIAAGGLDTFKEMFLPESSIVISTNSVGQAFALLGQGRVDAVVAFDFDVNMLKKQLPSISTMAHDPNYIIAANEDLMSCWRSPATEAFIQYVNIRLAEMRQDGRLQALTSD